jgi:hypothetical protein
MLIRSNDSSAAVWYGRYHYTYNEEGKIDNIILEKPDLENRNSETKEALDRADVRIGIFKNVIEWHMASKR